MADGIPLLPPEWSDPAPYSRAPDHHSIQIDFPWNSQRAKTMSDANSRNPDLAALENDIATLKRDVASLIGHLKAGIANGAQGAAGQIEDGAASLYNMASAEGDRAVKAVIRQVEEQPLLCLLIALGVGYVGGRLLSR